jgi:hypothetical protein
MASPSEPSRMGRRRGQTEACYWHDVYTWRPPENTSPRQQRRLKHASLDCNNPSNLKLKRQGARKPREGQHGAARVLAFRLSFSTCASSLPLNNRYIHFNDFFNEDSRAMATGGLFRSDAAP